MRLIHFKCWNHQTNKWLPEDEFFVDTCGLIYLLEDGGKIFFPHDLFPHLELSRIIWGINDANGKKIFEGDILKCANHTKNFYRIGFVSISRNGEIIFNTRDFGYFLKNINQDRIEIIGNKFENGELLNDW